VALEVTGIHLADDQWHRRVHPPRRAVVDHRGAARDGKRRQLARRLAAGREERDVDALERVAAGEADLVRRAVDRDRLAGRSL